MKKEGGVPAGMNLVNPAQPLCGTTHGGPRGLAGLRCVQRFARWVSGQRSVRPRGGLASFVCNPCLPVRTEVSTWEVTVIEEG